MKVRSLENHNGLTKGRVYEVLIDGGALVSVLNDHGIKESYYKTRFEVVSDTVPCPEPTPPHAMTYPTTSAARKEMPVYRGCVLYFPAALALVSALSKKGNDKHNPGEPMHHARGKSNDHGDCIARHLSEVGTIDPDTGLDHAVSLAWRALALLQELAENEYGWPKAPGAK